MRGIDFGNIKITDGTNLEVSLEVKYFLFLNYIISNRGIKKIDTLPEIKVFVIYDLRCINKYGIFLYIEVSPTGLNSSCY